MIQLREAWHAADWTAPRYTAPLDILLISPNPPPPPPRSNLVQNNAPHFLSMAKSTSLESRTSSGGGFDRVIIKYLWYSLFLGACWLIYECMKNKEKRKKKMWPSEQAPDKTCFTSTGPSSTWMVSGSSLSGTVQGFRDYPNCNIIHTTLDTCPRYKALSYAWANASDLMPCPINGNSSYNDREKILFLAYCNISRRKKKWRSLFVGRPSYCIQSEGSPSEWRRTTRSSRWRSVLATGAIIQDLPSWTDSWLEFWNGCALTV